MSAERRRHLESLDVLRGMAVAAMIAVNNPGSWNAVYPPLQHASWNGLTIADLVFPCFIVIMGSAMPFSFERRRQRSSSSAHAHILRRTLILIALGLALNVVEAWPVFREVRVPGVLQRIALTYCFAALIVLHMQPNGQLWTAGALLLGHWALLSLIPFNGVEAGVLTRDHNLAAYVDHRVFGAHLLTATGDPEGLLGVPPSVATALIGAATGRWLQRSAERQPSRDTLLLAATVMLPAGIVWGWSLPMNKQLWTGSYVLVTASATMFAIAVLHVIVDVRKVNAWSRPFVWLGLNALAIYFWAELVRHLLERPVLHSAGTVFGIKDFIFWHWVVPITHDAGGARSSLLFALGCTTVWVAAAGLLHRRGIRVRA